MSLNFKHIWAAKHASERQRPWGCEAESISDLSRMTVLPVQACNTSSSVFMLWGAVWLYSGLLMLGGEEKQGDVLGTAAQCSCVGLCGQIVNIWSSSLDFDRTATSCKVRQAL